MRDIADTVGITERAVQRIVEDLNTRGYIIIAKDGRRNRYEIQPDVHLSHPLTQHFTLGELLRFLYPPFITRAGNTS